MSHRGISLKIIGVKTVYDVASGDALFISELGPLPENVTLVIAGRGVSEVERHSPRVKDTEAEKLFRIREAEETKKQPDAGSQ